LAIYFINDQFRPEQEATIGITDLGLLRSYGVFDFFRVIDGKPLFLSDHLVRFSTSATALGLAIPYTAEQLTQIIKEAISLNPAPLLGIKLILTGGYSPDGYTPTLPNFMLIAKPFSFANVPGGMNLMSLQHQRELPSVKSLNYMVPIYNLPKMNAMGAQDLLYHHQGQVSELSRSNLFIVKNGSIITPSQQILHGITRKHVLALASQIAPVYEQNVTMAEVLEADEVFTTGSTKRILKIGKIDGQTVGQTSTIIHKLQSMYIEYEGNFNK
jgi:branched-chain amino acid aminotransferase